MDTAMVDVPTGDGVADAYLAHPDDGRRYAGHHGAPRNLQLAEGTALR
jgi:hypothetical protein